MSRTLFLIICNICLLTLEQKVVLTQNIIQVKLAVVVNTYHSVSATEYLIAQNNITYLNTSYQFWAKFVNYDIQLSSNLKKWQPDFLINVGHCPILSSPSNVSEILLDGSHCSAESVGLHIIDSNFQYIYLHYKAKTTTIGNMINFLKWSPVNLLITMPPTATENFMVKALSKTDQNIPVQIVQVPQTATETNLGTHTSHYVLLSEDYETAINIIKQTKNRPLILSSTFYLRKNSTSVLPLNRRSVCMATSFNISNCRICQLSPNQTVNNISNGIVAFLLSDTANLLSLEKLGQLESVLQDIVTTYADFHSALVNNSVEARVQTMQKLATNAEQQWISCFTKNSVGTNPIVVGHFTKSQLQFMKPPFPDEVLLLQNKTFIVGTKMVAPFTFPGFTNKKGFEKNVTGLSIDMLNELARRLHFNYKLKLPPDGFWGAPNPDGITWNGMIGYILTGEMDFAIGPFTMTAIRETVIDFSTPFMEDGNGIVIKKPGQQNSMFRVLSPFATESWLMIAVSIVVASLAVFLCSYVSPFSAWNLKLDERITDEISFRENIWSSLGTLLQQGQDFFPAASSARVILGTWWIVVVVLMSYYTADMIGYLTLYIPEKTVSSLEDIADQTALLPTVKTGTNAYTLFEKATPGTTYAKIFKLMSGMPLLKETHEGIDLVAKATDKQYAFMTDSTQLRYQTLTDCNLMLLPDIFNMATFGWPLPENSPYKPIIDSEIRRMVESGMMARWVKKWWRASNLCTPQSDLSESMPINFSEVAGTFVILGGFYVLALSSLLIEYCVSYIKKRKKFSLPHNPNKHINGNHPSASTLI